MKARRLSTHLAVLTVLAVGIALAVFTVIELFIGRETGLREVIVHHVAEAVLLGGIIWVVLIISLRRLLAEPLEAIYINLYAVGWGREKRLHIVSKVTEIAGIVEGINMMLMGKDRNHGETDENPDENPECDN